MSRHKTIPELDELIDIHADDFFLVADMQTGTTKKVRYSNMFTDTDFVTVVDARIAARAPIVTGWVKNGTDVYLHTITDYVGLGTIDPQAHMHVVDNNLGNSGVEASGFFLDNQTLALVNAQQYSPTITLGGHGWKTTATAASQPVKFQAYVAPVQGTTAPTGNFIIASSINNAAYTTRLTLTSAGGLTITGGLAIVGSITGVTSIAASSTVTSTQTLTTTPANAFHAAAAASTAAIPVRISPSMIWSGSAWNITPTAIANSNAIEAYLLPVSGATTSGVLIFANRTVNNVANNTELMRLTTAGNLTVSGSVTAASFVGSGSNLTGLPWTRTGSNVLLSTITDNVGIGTSATGDKLTVGEYETPTFTSNQDKTVGIYGSGAAYFRGRDTLNDIEFIMGTSVSGYPFIASITNHPLVFRVNNSTEVMRMATNGNVAVGTSTTTLSDFTVYGRDTATPTAIFRAASSSPTVNIFEVRNFNDTVGLATQWKTGMSASAMALWVNGPMAIGGTAVNVNNLLTIAGNLNDPTASSTGGSFSRTLVLTAANGFSVTGGTFNVSTQANAFNITGSVKGGNFSFNNGNTATVDDALAGDFLAYNTGIGTITRAYGVNVTKQNLVAAGTVGKFYGYAVQAGFNNGTVTDNYGFYMFSPFAAVNNYGIYLETVTAGTTLNYAIYSAGGKSYHAGNFGIGDTDAVSALTVRSNSENASGVEVARFRAIYTNATIGSGVSISFASAANSVAFGRIRSEISASAVADLTFHTYNASLAEQVRIKGNGDVGIQTSTPLTSLQVAKNVTAFSNTNVYSQLEAIGKTTQTHRLALGVLTATYGGSVAGTGFIQSLTNASAWRNLHLNPMGGNVGVGLGGGATNIPLALLDIGASDATAASLRIRAGVAPTTPNDGDIWNDGTDLKVRLGGATYTLTKV